MNEINLRIKELRLHNGLTMAKFAEILQVSAGNISDWEGGKKKSTPTAKALIKISEHFKVSLDWLLTGKETRDCAEARKDRNSDELAARIETLSREDFLLLDMIVARLSKAGMLPASDPTKNELYRRKKL